MSRLGVKFVTKNHEPQTKVVEVTLEEGEDGVCMMVDGYYICTLLNNGRLSLHIDIGTDTIQKDNAGAIITNRDR
jgi:hypothetical protein